MVAITDEKFLEYVDNTLLDFKEVQSMSGELVPSLENILETKHLTVTNCVLLIDLLEKKTAKTYEEQIRGVLAVMPMSEEKARKAIMSIKVEHDYMREILSKYFEWERKEDLELLSVVERESPTQE